jgi:hypothetical protein
LKLAARMKVQVDGGTLPVLEKVGNGLFLLKGWPPATL